jgi:hypothetical protein
LLKRNKRGDILSEPVVIEVQVARLVFDETIKTPVVILKEVGGDRILPIWIGQFEASAIAFALEGVEVERPLTHDLIKLILDGIGASVEKIVINDLRNNTFYARIILKVNHSLISIDARPSDSIALALRTKAPIFVAEDILTQSGTQEIS